MSDKVNCPFCGIYFETQHSAATTHPTTDCAMSMCTMSIDQWNKRPPKKEEPAMPTIESEVVWLRRIVEKHCANPVLHVPFNDR